MANRIRKDYRHVTEEDVQQYFLARLKIENEMIALRVKIEDKIEKMKEKGENTDGRSDDQK